MKVKDMLLFLGAPVLVVVAVLGFVVWFYDAMRWNCYSSTMGNPDQVVMMGDAPYACSNNLRGYRCRKMEPCK